MTAGANTLDQAPRARPYLVDRGLTLLKHLGIGVSAGLLAGFFAAGWGLRISMRIVALLADERIYGSLTDAGEPVGRISTDGTMFLVLSGTFLGLFFGLLFAFVRGFFPRMTPFREGLLYGFLLMISTAWITIETDGIDFTRFTKPAIALGLFLVLYPLFGATLGFFAGWIGRGRTWRVRNRWVMLAGRLAVAPLLVIGLIQGFRDLQVLF